MGMTVTEDAIAAVCDALAERIGPQKYRIWFKHSTKLTLTDGYLNVGVPNLFIASWIENHFANEIAQGIEGSNYKIILDRRKAIASALKMAQANDIVLVLGKGTEATLVAGSQKNPWDDRKVVREELERL